MKNYIIVLVALLCGLVGVADAQAVVLDADTYADKVYACWLGKAVGGTLGLPVEGQRGFFNFTFYDPVPTEQGANDDLDLQLLWLKALEERGPRLDERTLGEYWLEYVPVDWNEYGIGKANMRRGLPPPLSGQVRNHWKDSNGAWIRSEIWACVAPGCPDLAARYAWADASVDHGAAEGTWAEVFTATLESAAFVEQDPDRLLDIALSYIPAESAVAKAVAVARQAHRDKLELQVARDAVVTACADTGWFMAPQNVAFVVLGWLYGANDFGDSICAAVNCGDDTDCTGATLGSLLGILHGSAAIPERWRAPVGEGIRNVAIGGFTPPQTLTELTARTVAMAERVLVEHRAPVRIGQAAGDPSTLSLTSEATAQELWARSPYVLRADLVNVGVALDLHGEPLVPPGQDAMVTVNLTNRTPNDQNVELSWSAEAGLEVPPASVVVVGANGVLAVEQALRLTDFGGWRRVTLRVAPQGKAEQALIPFSVGRRRASFANSLTRLPGVMVTVDSEFERDPSPAARLIDGLTAEDGAFDLRRWHSALTPPPHWAMVELPEPRAVRAVVLSFADPLGYATSFRGEGSLDGQTWFELFDQTGWTDAAGYETQFAPQTLRYFRVLLRESANPAYANSAQLSEIELLPAP